MTFTLQPTLSVNDTRRYFELKRLTPSILEASNGWRVSGKVALEATFDVLNNRTTYTAEVPPGSYITRVVFLDASSNITYTFQSQEYDCPFASSIPALYGSFLPCRRHTPPDYSLLPCSHVEERSSATTVSYYDFAAGTCDSSDSELVTHLRKGVLTGEVDWQSAYVV